MHSPVEACSPNTVLREADLLPQWSEPVALALPRPLGEVWGAANTLRRWPGKVGAGRPAEWKLGRRGADPAAGRPSQLRSHRLRTFQT